jgi:hypothetical protein
VDTPKGDLDASLSVGDYSDVVLTGSSIYPYGTTEGFPLMEDSAGNVIPNTAHDYMECSNKGLCDRAQGICECLPGYDGAACQRASCPSTANSNTPGSGQASSNVAFKVFTGKSSFNGRAIAIPQKDQCSGHGTCMTIGQLAFLDHGNSYDLWDKHSTMGCKCDSGYTGPDCSKRTCVHGVDPLYTDDTSAQVTHTTVRIESSDADALSGEYAIRFWDSSGEDYITKGIPVAGDGMVDGGPKTHCDAVREAFLELPNRIVPNILCSQSVIDTDRGVEYTLTFLGNPGKLRQIELDQYLDGSRPTVEVSTGTFTMGVHTNVVGESVDYFTQRCESITVKILADSASDNTWTAGNVRPGSLGYLSGPDGPLTAAEMKTLKKCLGDSDWDPDNNVEVADWDYGVVVENDGVNSYNMIGAHPHAIKVVPKEDVTGYNKYTPGSYHLIWFDEDATGKEFRVANLNSDANDVTEATEMYIYTTKGTVQQMGYGTEPRIADNSSGGASSTRIVGYFDKDTNKIYTNYDTSCKNNPSAPDARNHVCVEKGDKLFVLDSCWGRGDLGIGAPSPIFGGTALNACADSTIPSHKSGNIYTVTKVYTTALGPNSANSPDDTIDITSDPSLKRMVDTYIIEVDASFGWEGLRGDPENSNTAGDDTTWSDNTGVVTLFHFTPHDEGTYEYVSECSNRGLCNRNTALCECFSGYTGGDCSVQNVLALSDADKQAALQKKNSGKK